LWFAVAINAQISRGEVFIGFSHGQVDGSTARFSETDDDFRSTGALKFNGFTASGVYNVSRCIGIKADFSATYHGGEFNRPVNATTRVTGEGRNSLYNFLAGVQFKNNETTRRVKPFGHVLFGAGHARTRVTSSCVPSGACTNAFVTPSSTETGFAAAYGGGIDLRLNDRFYLRLVQFDYNPVSLDSGKLHNVRFGVGLVIK
jgi:hypothetical protein